MNDCYTSMEKDPSSTASSKYIPLYHHEQVPFQSFQLRPSHPIKTPTQQNHPSMNNTNSNNDCNTNNNTNSCDLQDIILCYQSQPDLLRLILSSKLEEDKRRAEEAKLKAKELDLLLLQQQQQMMTPALASPSTSSSSSTIPPPSITSNDQSNFSYSSFSFQPMQQQQSSMESPFTGISHPLNTVTSPPPSQRRPMNDMSSLSTSPPSPSSHSINYDLKRSQSNPFNLPDHSTSSDETNQRSFQPPPSCHPASSPTSYVPLAEHHDGIKQPEDQPFMDDNNIVSLSSANLRYDPYAFPTASHHDAHPNHPHPYHQQSPTSSRPRRRREMQAITKIVETRDYPYIDGHSWRNNGNTVQKKTGNKSVYYKCANSIKGCAVNKTLTWRGNGEYLIKYRGEHLPECSKMQCILDA